MHSEAWSISTIFLNPRTILAKEGINPERLGFIPSFLWLKAVSGAERTEQKPPLSG